MGGAYGEVHKQFVTRCSLKHRIWCVTCGTKGGSDDRCSLAQAVSMALKSGPSLKGGDTGCICTAVGWMISPCGDSTH